MKHTNKIFTLIVGGVLLTQPLLAASTYVDPFDSTPKPRSLAMGNTGVAYGNDVHTVFYNPASLGGIKGMQFLASSGATLQDVNNTTEVMAFPIGSSQTAAVSLGYSAFQVSNILNANYVQGVPTIVGAASFSNSVFFASAANQTSFGKFGILAKSFNNNLSLQGPGTGFSGQGTNVDVGALWSLNSSTQVGLAFKNVLSTQSIKYSSGAVDALAQKTVLGIGTRFVNSSGNYLGLAMDYEYISNTPGYGLWHGGVEWGFDRNIALRAGMNQVLQSQQNVVVASQLTLGVGVRWSGLHLDYAYYPDFGELGDAKHFFGIAYVGLMEDEVTVAQETKKPAAVAPATVEAPVITTVYGRDHSIKLNPKKDPKQTNAEELDDSPDAVLQEQNVP